MIINVHPKAQDELLESVLWYNIRKPRLGNEFFDTISSVIDQISQNPKQFPYLTNEKQIQVKVVKRFPFSVIFKVEADQLLILAVAHNKRKPNYWIKRKSK